MNWKTAGKILITLGVTATTCYVSYSLIVQSKKKDFDNFKEVCKDSDLVKKMTPEKELLMAKKAKNLTKKQLKRFSQLCLIKELEGKDKEEFETLKKKWGYE